MDLIWSDIMGYIVQLLSGAMGAAIVVGVFSLIQDKRKKKDIYGEALKHLLLYNIQERAKKHLADGYISLEDRRLLHSWHDVYHNGLEGNGDADILMVAVDKLPLSKN